MSSSVPEHRGPGSGRDDASGGRTGQPPVSGGPPPELHQTPPTRKPAAVPDRASVVARQREQFGGLKFGATFFGWLAAAGAGVLMTAFLASVGAGIGLSTGVDPGQANQNTTTIGIISVIALLVVILVAYFCGGYVAGRMARFNGAKQGLGVWLWGIIAAVVIAILAGITGNQVNVAGYLAAAPQIPISGQSLTTAGIVAALAVIVVALIGAVLGGLAGMRFHRRVDRVADEL